MQHRRARIAAGASLIAGLGMLGVTPASASTLAGYTWSGADAATSSLWSDAANWQGGIGPTSGSTGNITFPAAACSASGCPGPSSTNDLTGVTASPLSIGLAAGAPSGWQIQGNALTIGNMSVSTDTSGGTTVPTSTVSLPLALDPSASSPWLWTIGLVDGANFNLGPVTGAPALAVVLPSSSATGGAGFLGTTSIDTGALTFQGSTSGANSVVVTGTSLNGKTKKPVKFLDSFLFSPGGSTASLKAATTTYGPLTLKGTAAQFGNGGGTGPYGYDLVKGGVTIDAKSHLTWFSLEPGTGTRPGLDYPQLSASGKVALGSAGLTLFAPCTSQALGTTYTIIVGAKGVTGTFAGTPSGTVVTPIGDSTCPSGTNPGYAFKISYNTATLPATVTATVVAAGTTGAQRSVRPAQVWTR